MSLGTRLFTLLNGSEVGRDSAGNIYYQARRTPAAGLRRRRWVMYSGEVEATRVPPEWHAWLHYTTEAPLPESSRPAWGIAHQPNRTGSAASYRPGGHDYAGGQRAATGSDYEAWTPDAG